MDYLDDKNTPIGTTRSSELGSEGDGKERARQTAEDARDKAKEMASKARDNARSKGEQQKARATDEIEMLATALHDAGSQLDRQDMATGRFIHAAADRLQNFSERLDSRDVDGLVREGRQWARRNPAAFLGSAVAVGFLASRFLKATPEDDEWDDYGYDREIPTDLPGSAGFGAGTESPMTTTPGNTS
ncbi:MAG: hypothetical protein KY432_09640, partial [Acidobacteria bacterium]|nr:hypothetical protein [Acidobacteriota bacterium]